MRRAFPVNAHRKIVPESIADRGLARRIDWRHHNRVRIVEAGAELVEQRGKPRIAVRLHDAAQPAPVLVNIFASWCAPCEVEHPVLVELKKQGVRVVGVAYKDAPENTKAFIGRLGDPYAQRLVDRDGRAGIDLGVTGVPETYLVGANGTILAKHTGPLTPETAGELLAKAPR